MCGYFHHAKTDTTYKNPRLSAGVLLVIDRRSGNRFAPHLLWMDTGVFVSEQVCAWRYRL